MLSGDRVLLDESLDPFWTFVHRDGHPNERDFAGVLAGHALERGLQLFAVRTPGCPELHDDRRLADELSKAHVLAVEGLHGDDGRGFAHFDADVLRDRGVAGHEKHGGSERHEMRTTFHSRSHMMS